MVLFGFKVETYIIRKLKKQIIRLLKLLERITFNLNTFLIKKKTSWCKCLLSGFKGENFLLNFLMMEKRFSKQGYHINEIKKYGEILGLLMCELIIMNPRKKLNKYAPLSPSIKIFEIFKSKRSSNRINIKSINLSEIIKLSTKPKFIKKYKTINV